MSDMTPYTFRQYHEEVGRHASYPQQGDNLVYPALGLVGEAGELAEKIKKLWRNHGLTGLYRPVGAPLITDPAVISLWQGILKEGGDVLWYLDRIASEAGTTLENIARMNAFKLADRAARGVIKSEGDNR